MENLQSARAETERNHPVPKDLADQFREVLSRHPRVAIAGGPRVGKTTLAKSITDRRVFLAKEFESVAFDEIPTAMLAATAEWRSFVVEGVMVARMLRRAARMGLPASVDAVLYLHRPHVERTPRQIGMAKGIHKIFKDWRALDRETPVYVFE